MTVHGKSIRSQALTAFIVFGTLAAGIPSRAESVDGKPVQVRLLVADNSNAASDSATLKDVLPTLQQNLRFRSYRLVCARSLKVGTGAVATLEMGFSLIVTAIEEEAFTVEVRRWDKRLIRTKVKLAPDHPIILGGFPDQDEKQLIVVVSM